MVANILGHSKESGGKLSVGGKLQVVGEHLIEGHIELVKERALDGSNYVGKSLNILWVVFNTICEQKRNLLGLNAVTGDKISLHSLD